jgi:ribonuclease HI
LTFTQFFFVTEVAMSTKDRLQPLVINTDGSAFRNGKQDAIAGVGVYFVCRDIKSVLQPSAQFLFYRAQGEQSRDTLTQRRNIGVPLGKGKQTNQRAELTAILLALEKAPADRDVLIRSDSKYAINCVTDWGYKWAHRSWRKPAGIVMENMDIIEPILQRTKTRRMFDAKTKYEWVKGHAGDQGNTGADRLAKQGSK